MAKLPRLAAAAAKPTALYLLPDDTLSFSSPTGNGPAYREYASDPSSPVPYRKCPISPDFNGKGWSWWEADDQRFVEGRLDVLTYVSAPLEQDLVISGEIAAELFAPTSGTDSDFVVKLIDVFPEDYPDPDKTPYKDSLRGISFLLLWRCVGGDIWKPKALVPERPILWDVPLRSHDHVFRKVHRIMGQVQSSWFPVIDRNPQRFVSNIYKISPEDFIYVTQQVYSTCSCPRVSFCPLCHKVRSAGV